MSAAPKVGTVEDFPRPPDPFPAIGAAQIFAPLPPVQWVVQALDICPGPPAMFAGYGYSGKTMAAQAMALEIAGRVGQVWGCFHAPVALKDKRVIHLDFEQGPRLTAERYQRLAVHHMLGPSDLEGCLSLVSMPPTYLDSAGVEDALCRAVEGHSLAIVDSLRAAIPSIEENSSEARRPLDMLHRVSVRTGAAFLVIHHARKSSTTDNGDARMVIRGSSALFDACSSIFVFHGAKDAPVRVSHEKARTSGILADDFELEVTDVPDGNNPRAGLLVWAKAATPHEDLVDERDKARRLARTEQLRGELRELFGREPEQGGTQSIAVKLGRKRDDVRGALALMVEVGEVEAIGSTKDRRYRLVSHQEGSE